jgi:hypothetical protein
MATLLRSRGVNVEVADSLVVEPETKSVPIERRDVLDVPRTRGLAWKHS